ncbi:hypothetical protein GGS21DRAFT_77173 [Xylaria nigripes]|nr:hypothetical protein GGS21DRAFT_77173 [Xylaria nigripes]
MSEEESSSRPSFTQFWQSQQRADKNFMFISSKLGQQEETNDGVGEKEEKESGAATDKAKARRQQVRRAQLQHRQRKANYTKQLELDVTKLRDDIAAAEREILNLKTQNGDMRSRLLQAVEVPSFAGLLSPVTEYTVSLDFSRMGDLGTPAYQVSRTASSSPPPLCAIEGGSGLEMGLTEEQTDRVINFILALEHCCWNHINPTCFEHHQHHDKQLCLDPPAPTPPSNNDQEPPDDALNGHAFTATALALQSAPLEVFTHITGLQTPSPDPPTPISWATSTLTLANLRHLAGTVNPTDAELAPVQAWFELASRYGVAVATDEAVLRSLTRALVPETLCVVFGAAVPREVFEEVLERVIGDESGD